MEIPEVVPTQVVHSGEVFHTLRWAGDDAVATNGGASASAPALSPIVVPTPQPRGITAGGGVPQWARNLAFLLTILAVATLVAFGLVKLGQWLFDNDSSTTSAPAGITMPQILRSEHFAVNGHALCSYVTVANGTAYKLYLNRGGDCHNTVQAVIPANMVNGFHSKLLHHSTVTFVYNPKVYDVAQASNIMQLSLGRQVMVGLRNIVARERK